MENKQIKVIVKRPNSKTEIKTITDTLETYQKLVQGYIETIPFPNDENICFVANEEAKIFGLLPNICLPHFGDILCGTIVAVNSDEAGEFQSLTDKQINKVKHYIDTFNLDNLTFSNKQEIKEIMLKKLKNYNMEDDMC